MRIGLNARAPSRKETSCERSDDGPTVDDLLKRRRFHLLPSKVTHVYKYRNHMHKHLPADSVTLDSVTLGFSYPWVQLSLGLVTIGFSYPWVQLPLGSVILGFSYPWVQLPLGSVIHGFSYPWVQLSMGSVILGFS